MTEQLELLQTGELSQDAQELQEDRSLAGIVTLPDYTNTTESKVLRSVKDVFRGFDPDTDEASATRFDTPDALATYASNGLDDIRRIREMAEAENITKRAAALCRFWYLGQTLDKALSNGKYGTQAVNKIAAALRKSIPYIYQVRAVSVRLSVVDCFLLGARGLETTHLRKLAQIKDDGKRKGIIQAFVDMVRDTADQDVCDKARKALVAAVNADLKYGAVDVATSNPDEETEPASVDKAPEVSAEWDELMNCMSSGSKLLKKAVEPDAVQSLSLLAGDFYLMSNVPNAEERLEELKGAAVSLVATMKAVRNNIDSMLVDLEGLDSVELTQAEDDATP